MRRLEAQVKALQATLAAVTFDATTKELVITEANLRIVNGLGQTDCGPEDKPIPDCPNGLGNLIVGYNEPLDVVISRKTHPYGLTQCGGGVASQFLPLWGPSGRSV